MGGFLQKRESIALEEQRLKSTWVRPGTSRRCHCRKFGTPLTHEYNLLNLLSRPEIDYAGLVEVTGRGAEDPQVAEQVEIKTKYAGYIDRQQDEIARLRQRKYQTACGYRLHDHLRAVERDPEQAGRNSSGNLGQASRIPASPRQPFRC